MCTGFWQVIAACKIVPDSGNWLKCLVGHSIHIVHGFCIFLLNPLSLIFIDVDSYCSANYYCCKNWPKSPREGKQDGDCSYCLAIASDFKTSRRIYENSEKWDDKQTAHNFQFSLSLHLLPCLCRSLNLVLKKRWKEREVGRAGFVVCNSVQQGSFLEAL